MDHPFATPASPAFTPWRAAALVAIAVAAAELIALMVAGVALLDRSLADDGAKAKPAARAAAPAPVRHRTPKPAPTGPPKLTRAETSVLVLNGNGVAGAAAAASTHVRALHYMLGGVGNADSQTSRSMIMFRPGYRAEGLRLGRDLHVASVAPLDGLRVSDLMGAHLAYVVGS